MKRRFVPLNCSQGCPGEVNYRPNLNGDACCPSCGLVVPLADIIPHLDEGEVVGIHADTVGYWSLD